MVRVLVAFPNHRGRKVLVGEFETFAAAFRKLTQAAETYEGEELPGFELRLIVHKVAQENLAPGPQEEFLHG